MNDHELKKQLQAQRVKETELRELLSLANELKSVELPTLSPAARMRIEEVTSSPRRTLRTVTLSFAGSFAALAVLIMGAQYAEPGSPLYVIRQTTDNIQALFQPNDAEPAPDNVLEDIKPIEPAPMPAIEDSTAAPDEAPVAGQSDQTTTQPQQPSDNKPDEAKAAHDGAHSERTPDSQQNRFGEWLRRLFN